MDIIKNKEQGMKEEEEEEEAKFTREFSLKLQQFRHTPPTASTRSPPLWQPQKIPHSPPKPPPSPSLSPRKRKRVPVPSFVKEERSSYFSSSSGTAPGEGGGETERGEEEGEGEKITKKKKKKPARPYADPTVYAHLDGLNDSLEEGLDLILCGINPDANPTNHFYRVLHLSGLTPTLLRPTQSHLLPHQPKPYYKIGNTNLVPRPTREMSELSRTEMTQGVRSFLGKCVVCRPVGVAFVGVEVGRVVQRWLRDYVGTREPTTRKERKTVGVAKCGLQRFVISLPVYFSPSSSPSSDCKKEEEEEGNVEGQGRQLIHFYTLPSTSARVVAYQVCCRCPPHFPTISYS
ncbi:hypothetical protein T439DRAFT_330448 [Meredithblackwellia eburnea MCA 4105]